MTLSEDDIARIETIIRKAGGTIGRDTIQLESTKLSFQVIGSDRDGTAAIKALMQAGLNVYSDGDLDTQENYTTWKDGAAFCEVVLTLRPDGLWRS